MPAPLSPEWVLILPSLAPSREESWAMFCELRAKMGSDKLTAGAVGILGSTLIGWVQSGRVPRTGRRSVWCAWVAFCHPELVKTSFDWFTWGRWRTKVQEPGDWPEDYCI